MKKLIALGVAVLLFLISVICIHIYSIFELPHNNRNVGLWISCDKDASYEMVKANICDDTMLYLGSSEFHHCNRSESHPSKFFNREGIAVMCIGSAFNQSLANAMIAGAVGPELKNRKLVLLLSPTWFYASRNSETAYGMRYTRSYYLPLMNNPDLSRKTKDKVKAIANKSYDGGVTESFLESEKSLARSGISWFTKGRIASSNIERSRNSRDPDFAELAEYAEKAVSRNHNTEYNMRKTARPLNPIEFKASKDKNAKMSFEASKEYEYLRLFLDICNEQDIEVLLVIQPLNGKWYDYTGLTEDMRKVCYRNIGAIAEEKGAKLVDLSDEEYTDGFFIDAVHPSEKGWLRINEEVYKFYKD